MVWSDVHSVKRALLSLSKKYTEEELEELKKELRMREKDGKYLYQHSIIKIQELLRNNKTYYIS